MGGGAGGEEKHKSDGVNCTGKLGSAEERIISSHKKNGAFSSFPIIIL